MAFSIHELALIVGEEITNRDLVPVFDGFLNDIDEVRIGVLKHLADFLKVSCGSESDWGNHGIGGESHDNSYYSF